MGRVQMTCSFLSIRYLSLSDYLSVRFELAGALAGVLPGLVGPQLASSGLFDDELIDICEARFNMEVGINTRCLREGNTEYYGFLKTNNARVTYERERRAGCPLGIERKG